jgi:glycosyltransferase involved in cell wall biosynthesis
MLRWVKGLEYALLAVAELARQGVPVTLDILGGNPDRLSAEPSERDRLVAAIDALGLGERVTIHGRVIPQEVAERLAEADAYLQTSLSEGHPTALVEAMACELAVVATDVGGTREAVTDGVEGFLVPARDWRAAARALRRVHESPELAARLGAAGRARVEREFLLADQTGRFVELYRDAIARCS